MKTYEVIKAGAAIRCLICGLTSWHPDDVRFKYCGYCHNYHDQMERLGFKPGSNAPQKKPRH
jgi:hypothetical protein